MIRFILLNLVFAGLYLWGSENNRMLCLVLLLLVPFIDLIIFGIIEKKAEKGGYNDLY